MNRMKSAAQKNKGFTLIELLVVIAIIGLLASVILASLNTARQKGRDARRLSDVKELQLALELYYDSNSSYPTSLAALAPAYISVIPTDPSSNLSYAYAGLQGTASSASTCGAYHLGAKLEVAGQQALLSDVNGVPGGTYNVSGGDGPVCTNGSWAGDADIAASGGDFAVVGTTIYDVKP